MSNKKMVTKLSVEFTTGYSVHVQTSRMFSYKHFEFRSANQLHSIEDDKRLGHNSTVNQEDDNKLTYSISS